jgi:hypothetical protein
VCCVDCKTDLGWTGNPNPKTAAARRSEGSSHMETSSPNIPHYCPFLCIFVGVTYYAVVSMPFGCQSPATAQLQLLRELRTRQLNRCSQPCHTSAYKFRAIAFLLLSDESSVPLRAHHLQCAWRHTGPVVTHTAFGFSAPLPPR